MTRDARGRYIKGCPAGPGRPANKPPATPLEADQLIIQAMLQRQLNDAWRHIEASYTPDVVRELAREIRRQGNPLPARIAALIDAET